MQPHRKTELQMTSQTDRKKDKQEDKNTKGRTA